MKTQSSSRRSPVKAPAERVVKDIRRATRRHFSAEDKIRTVLDGLRGDDGANGSPRSMFPSPQYRLETCRQTPQRHHLEGAGA